MTLHRNRTRLIFGTLAAGLVATGAITAYAFNTIFARPGEASLRFVPEEALMVMSIDLSPSPQQALLFKRIDDTLAKHDLLDVVNGSPIDMISGGPLGKKIRGHALRSGSIAMLKPEEKMGDPRMVGFIGLTDAGKVSELLRKEGKPFFFRGTRSWKLDGGSGVYVSVFDNVLAISDSPKTLHHIELVADGTAPSILKNEGFLRARKQVDADANLLMAYAPEIANQWAPEAPQTLTHWGAMSMALRDEGMGMVMNGEFDTTKIAGLAKLAETPALRQDLYSVLPSGAYGFFALSSPAHIYDFFGEFMKDEESFAEGLKSFKEEFQTNMGMDLEKDFVSGFRGTTVLAAYPTAGKEGGIDLLAVVDDLHGAKPSVLVEKMMGQFAEQARQSGEEAPFNSRTADGVTYYTLRTEFADEMTKDMSIEDDVVKGDLLMEGKTVAFATVGSSVVVASSEAMLAKGVEALKNKNGGLKNDAGWGTALQSVGEDQYVMGFNLAKLAQGVRNTMNLDKLSADERKPVEEGINAFASLKEPLFSRSWMKADRYSTTLIIPMDYEKVIDLAASFFAEEK